MHCNISYILSKFVNFFTSNGSKSKRQICLAISDRSGPSDRSDDYSLRGRHTHQTRLTRRPVWWLPRHVWWDFSSYRGARQVWRFRSHISDLSGNDLSGWRSQKQTARPVWLHQGPHILEDKTLQCFVNQDSHLSFDHYSSISTNNAIIFWILITPYKSFKSSTFHMDYCIKV